MSSSGVILVHIECNDFGFGLRTKELKEIVEEVRLDDVCSESYVFATNILCNLIM